ncbi:unnamed protein product [Brachionus calyciflorus]|uniref:DDE Tnp4 domain-containing protein n=1 Tax=Brachionus calyciflorus TaxID=104777 RepID=A0A814GYU7_9BILA|nr:unnamed protein product [Brachionus calyciflorus]
MVINFFDLESDDLAVVIDGTYTRLEKSANNKFQYSCWSGQKKDLLIKPFVICCADGYFLDCYGPFEAFENDAKIFKYIIENDSTLRKILLPEKTILFIDRGNLKIKAFTYLIFNNLDEGFRDIFDLLKNELKLNPKIPTCSQLEDDQNESSNVKQLTSKQTTESRLVTKIRFIVEKQIGMIKNFKALDNIRNTQAGHIQIDYRITCAMINFTHKPTCPDKENAKKIAVKLKEKLDFENNLLSGLLKRQFGTKEIFSIDHNSIKDFPKLNYVCSCKSGLKVAGCCTHVSSAIYYFSFARYQQIRIPGDHLNKIFLDKIKKQKPNEPKYVRHKRFAVTKVIEDNMENYEIDSDEIQLNDKQQKKLILEKKSLERKSKKDKKSLEKKRENENNKPKNKTEKNTKNNNEEIQIDLLIFKGHLPSWGCKIQYNDRDILLTNTCDLGRFFYLILFLFYF